MGFLTLISNALSALGSWIGFQKQKDAERNTAAVVAGQQRVNEQAAVDASAEAIRKGKIDEIRKDLAE